MLGGEAKLTATARKNLIKSTCLKAILYVSSEIVVTEDLWARLRATFSKIPLVVVRAHTLPKNAPIELEMMAMATKSQHKVEHGKDSLTVVDR